MCGLTYPWVECNSCDKVDMLEATQAFITGHMP